MKNREELKNKLYELDTKILELQNDINNNRIVMTSSDNLEISYLKAQYKAIKWCLDELDEL